MVDGNKDLTLRIKNLDNSVTPYVNYICELSERKFSGKTDFQLNWQKGGITNMNIKTEPLPGVVAQESVRLI